MSNENGKSRTNPARRKLLKGLGGTSSALLVGGALPQQWTRPVIDAVLLPAHAAGTGVVIRAGGGGGGSGSSSLLEETFDFVVPKANAEKVFTPRFYGCIEFEFTASDGKITSLTLVELWVGCGGSGKPPSSSDFYLSASGVSMSGGQQVWTANISDTNGRDYKIELTRSSDLPDGGSGHKLGSVLITRTNPTSGPPRDYERFDVFEGFNCNLTDTCD